MKRPSPYRDRKTLQVAMTPMIDVVFLLLVFFIWTASFQVVEYLLPSSVSPPTASGAAAEKPLDVEDFEQVVVRIQGGPQSPTFAINDRPPISELSQVKEILQVLASANNQVPMIIDPDDQVPVGTVIQVFDLGRLVNFQEIQFAVEIVPAG